MVVATTECPPACKASLRPGCCAVAATKRHTKALSATACDGANPDAYTDADAGSDQRPEADGAKAAHEADPAAP